MVGRNALRETKLSAPDDEEPEPYWAHLGDVERWARRLGGPAIDSEDVVQDVMLIACRKWSSFSVRLRLRRTSWRCSMTANATVTAELIRAQARRLRLPGLAKSFEGLGRQARESNWEHEEYLRENLSAEEHSRNESVVRHRIRTARFPETKSLDTFEFSSADGIDPAIVAQLSRCDWIREARNLIVAGPVGTGKSHLAIALGVEATKNKCRVAFVRTADLVRDLIEARDARERTRSARFELAWLLVRRWLEAEPERNAKDLFKRLQEEQQGIFPDNQLRTLQRRVQQWR
jgi:DNA-directed RNA polymerase specialized sigma24 family protein